MKQASNPKSAVRRRAGLLAAGAALLLGTSAPLSAQQAVQAEAPQAVPQIQHAGPIAYVTGGVGSDNRDQTLALGRGMGLQLVFARSTGAYLADVDVEIARPDGEKVLDLPSAEPMLFAELPPGRYRVTASADGHTLEREVQVPAQGQHTEWFHWPDAGASGSGR